MTVKRYGLLAVTFCGRDESRPYAQNACNLQGPAVVRSVQYVHVANASPRPERSPPARSCSGPKRLALSCCKRARRRGAIHRARVTANWQCLWGGTHGPRAEQLRSVASVGAQSSAPGRVQEPLQTTGIPPQQTIGSTPGEQDASAREGRARTATETCLSMAHAPLPKGAVHGQKREILKPTNASQLSDNNVFKL